MIAVKSLRGEIITKSVIDGKGTIIIEASKGGGTYQKPLGENHMDWRTGDVVTFDVTEAGQVVDMRKLS